MTATIDCPRCGVENEYDDDNDVILCEECGELIYAVDEEGFPSIERGD